MKDGALAQRPSLKESETAILLAAIVGSGIMAERLAGVRALALLCNAIAPAPFLQP